MFVTDLLKQIKNEGANEEVKSSKRTSMPIKTLTVFSNLAPSRL